MTAPPVDLFYCVRSRDLAPHLSELLVLAESKPNLTLHLIASNEGVRLSADRIAQHVGGDMSKILVSFCGPVALRDMLMKDLPRYGVTLRNFQYEEFEFRTGIGLKTLAAWVADRTKEARQ